ncbi:MAG TPA: aldo/keto reductase [Bryobacteraceae bacterium]|nr:aldo/keto reductase [Bryobacterales bacterium]HRJ19689.1 aldo/keto reductase [Bryobacteraceae bacterium]
MDPRPVLSRRGFAGALAATGIMKAHAAAPSKATEMVTLGKSGVTVTRLAQGTGFNGSARSSAHTRLGEKAFQSLIRHDLERGVTFMDAADLYGSHPYLRNALRGVPREKYNILTKLWPRTEFWNSYSGGAKAEIDRFRKEFATDQLDVVLIHCLTNDRWTNDLKRTMDEMAEMKQKGVVKAVGVSCHDFGALKVAAASPWTDVLLVRINNVGKAAAMDAPVEEVVPVIKQARAAGKGIIGMKIFGAGKLTAPEQRDASLKFVFQNKLVDAVTIGMLSEAEVNDTMARIDQAMAG